MKANPIFENFFHNSLQPLCIADKEGRFVRLNKEWQSLLGYEIAELEGRSYIELVHPQDVESTLQAARALLGDTQVFNFINRYRHKDGSFRWLEWRSYPEGDFVYASVRDITDIRKQEEILHRFKASIDYSPEAVYWVNEHAGFDYVNERACTMLGYTETELLGMTILDIDPGVGMEGHNELWDRYRKDASFRELYAESHHKRKDGNLVPVEISSIFLPSKDGLHLIALVKDISERKEQEALLKDREFFLRESQRAGKIGSYRMSFRTGTWIATETLDALFGIEKPYSRTVEGWLDLVHPGDRDRVERYFQDEVTGKHREFDLEYRIVRKSDKAVRWLHGLGTLYFDEKGELSEMLGTIQDITDRKAIEAEVQRIHADLERRIEQRTSELKQANQELEAFTYSVSHDLRAPIRHIQGYLQHMEDLLHPDDPRIKNDIRKIHQASDRMRIMIEELLRFSRLSRTEMHQRPVNLNHLIREYIERCKPDCEGRDIEWKIGELPDVPGDPALLSVALENLLSNALKYTSKIQRAIIRIQEEPAAPEEARFSIRDNGSGFNPAYKDKLFGVFQRLHGREEFEGLGIGLAIVDQIVKKHRGRIEADSLPGQGATFTVTLPRTA
ncbi:MAG: PAS domain S-box protein [Bacteroidales bacterium]